MSDSSKTGMPSFFPTIWPISRPPEPNWRETVMTSGRSLAPFFSSSSSCAALAMALMTKVGCPSRGQKTSKRGIIFP